MPSIFDEHNAVHAMKRIAAAKDETDLNVEDLQAVHELLAVISPRRGSAPA